MTTKTAPASPFTFRKSAIAGRPVVDTRRECTPETLRELRGGWR